MSEDSVFVDDDFCFACGGKNPLGLQLTFFEDGDRLCTLVHPKRHWQGFSGVVHGGLQATIMDDLMSNHLNRLHGVWTATAELALRYKKPVPIDSELLFVSNVTGNKGRVWETRAECYIAAESGSGPLTVGTARFIQIPRP